MVERGGKGELWERAGREEVKQKSMGEMGGGECVGERRCRRESGGPGRWGRREAGERGYGESGGAGEGSLGIGQGSGGRAWGRAGG